MTTVDFKYVTYSGQEVTVTNEAGEEIEIELNYPVPEWLQDTIQVKKTKSGWRVGYLLPDDDPQSPEEWDGTGYIGTRDRYRMDDRFREALGFDQYGERKFDERAALNELADELWPNDRDADANDALVDPDKGVEQINIKPEYWEQWHKLIERHVQDGDFGDPDRVMLDYYEHGGRSYYVSGEGHFPADGFDTSRGGAVWVPDDLLRNEEAKGLVGEKRHEMMITWAKQACEVYNQWMAGDVYGIIVYDYDKQGNEIKEIEECWGFYEQKYAEGELKSMMDWEPKKK